MLTTPTIEALRGLNLPGMAQALAEQLERSDYWSLSFEERFGLLVDREVTERDNRRLERNLKAAKLRSTACVEDLDFGRARGLDRGLVLRLAEAGWVAEHRTVIVTGPTGVYVACALAQAALRRGHRAFYLRVPRLLDELVLARADGRLPRLLAAWSKIDVLVLDDLALQPIPAARAADLLEVIEDRHGLRSTIVTSQLPVAHWHEALGEGTIADAILDRLVHSAYRIELRGDSLRRPERGTPTAAAPTARKPITSDGPDRPIEPTDTPEHPAAPVPSDDSTGLPDYPQHTERR